MEQALEIFIQEFQAFKREQQKLKEDRSHEKQTGEAREKDSLPREA